MDIESAKAWKMLIGEIAAWIVLFGFLWLMFIRRGDD